MVSAGVLFLECLILAFLQASGIEGRPMELILVLFALFAIAYFWDLGRVPRLKPVSVPLALGFLMRMGLLFFDLYGRSIYSLPNSGADSEMFYDHGMQYAIYGSSSKDGTFLRLLGHAFRWLGYSRIYVQFLLLLLSVVAIHALHRIMEEASISQNVRVKTMYLICLLPNFAILSAIFLRESVVTMLIALSVLCFLRWLRGRKEHWFWLAFALAFNGASFHTGSVAVAVGYILVRFFYHRDRRVFAFSWKNILPAVIFFMVFLYLFVNYGDRFFGKVLKIDGIEDIASGRGMGGSTYAAYVGDSSTVWNMIRYTPARVLYFLFSPFPWQWRGISDIIAFAFNSMFYIWTIVRAFRYLKVGYLQYRSEVIALLLVAMCTLFVFGWGVSNTGTAVRHRDKMVILYGILWALSAIPKQVVVQPKPITRWRGRRR